MKKQTEKDRMKYITQSGPFLTAAGVTGLILLLNGGMPVFAAEPDQLQYPAEDETPVTDEAGMVTESEQDTVRQETGEAQSYTAESTAATQVAAAGDAGLNGQADRTEGQSQVSSPDTTVQEPEQASPAPDQTLQPDEEQPAPAQVQTTASRAAAAGINAATVHTSLEGMVSVSDVRQVPVDPDNSASSAEDVHASGNVDLNLDLTKLLQPAQIQFDSMISHWQTAARWYLEGENHGAVIIPVNIALPAASGLSFAQDATYTSDSPLISSVKVTPQGTAALIQLTLNRMQYQDFFDAVRNGTAGSVHVLLPFSGTIAKGTAVPGTLQVTSDGTVIQHVTGFGLPINVGVDIAGTQASVYEAQPVKPAEGTVDETITVSGNLKADGKDAAYVKDSFDLTSTLDVSQIRQTMQEKVGKYAAQFDDAASVTLTGTEFGFTAQYTLPDGVVYDPRLSTAGLEGGSGFRITGVAQTGNTLMVTFGLADPDAVRNLADLMKLADLAGNDSSQSLALQLNGLQVTDAAVKNTWLPMTGNVNGELRTTASYTGARFNIRFGFVLDHEERAQIRIPDSVVYPQIQVDIDAAISAGDAAAGKMYDTVAGEDFSLTGSIDTSAIKQQLEAMIGSSSAISGGKMPADIGVSETHVTFTATFQLPDGMIYDGSQTARFTGSDAFQVESVQAEGNSVSVVFTLTDKAAAGITSLQDLMDIARNAGQTLSVTVPGFRVPAQTEQVKLYTVNGSVSGTMTASATSGQGIPVTLNLGFTGTGTADTGSLTAGVMVNSPVRLSLDNPSWISAGTAQPGTVYETAKGEPFALTGTMDASAIRTQLSELIAQFHTASTDPASIPVNVEDLTFTGVFRLPEGAVWTETGKPAFTGSDAFRVESVTLEDGSVSAKLTLNREVKTLRDLMDIADHTDGLLSLKLDGFSIADDAPEQTYTFSGSLRGSLKAAAVSSTGAPFAFDLTFQGVPETAKRSLKATVKTIELEVISRTVPENTTGSVENTKPGNRYQTEAGWEFTVRAAVDVQGLQKEVNALAEKYGLRESGAFPFSLQNMFLETYFAIPQGVNVNNARAFGSIEGTGGGYFRYQGTVRTPDGITVRMSLDPDRISTLADLRTALAQAARGLTVMLNGLDTSAPAGTRLTIPVVTSGELRFESAGRNGKPVIVQYQLEVVKDETASVLVLKPESAQSSDDSQSQNTADKVVALKDMPLDPASVRALDAVPSREGRNRQPVDTADYTQAGVFGGFLSLSAIALAAGALLRRKNRK